MRSTALETHFEVSSQKPEQMAPHEALRQQALAEAIKFWIPLDIATRVVDEKLAVVQWLFEKIREESKNTGGKLAELRANIDADMLAKQVSLDQAPIIEARLAEIQKNYRDDISSIIMETAEA